MKRYPVTPFAHLKTTLHTQALSLLCILLLLLPSITPLALFAQESPQESQSQSVTSQTSSVSSQESQSGIGEQDTESSQDNTPAEETNEPGDSPEETAPEVTEEQQQTTQEELSVEQDDTQEPTPESSEEDASESEENLLEHSPEETLSPSDDEQSSEELNEEENDSSESSNSTDVTQEPTTPTLTDLLPTLTLDTIIDSAQNLITTIQDTTELDTLTLESTPPLDQLDQPISETAELLPEELEDLLDVPVFETGVLTLSGIKDISQIRIGDKLIGYDFETDTRVVNTVKKIEIISPAHYNYWEQNEEGSYTTYIEVPFLFYIINNTHHFFQDQSVFANDRLVHAKDLEIGDILYTQDGEHITIETIVSYDNPSEWIKLSVSGNHTYISDGIVLHNATRYWVGGGANANWNATGNTNWGSASNTQDNASVPSASDDVIFDGVGFGASNSVLSANITINSLDMTGYTNTLTHSSNTTLTIAGNTFKLSPTMTYARSNLTSSAIFLTSTTGTSMSPTQITTAGQTLGNLTINGLAGHFRITDNLILDALATLILNAGTFDANNQNVSIGSFSSSNSNVRTLTVGSGTWNITGNNTTVWTTLLATNLTLTTKPTLNFTYNGAVGTRNIFTGTLSEALAPNINIMAGSDIVNFTGSADIIDFTGFSGSLANATRTIYGNLTLSPTMTITLGGNTTTFAATSGIQTITTSGIQFNQNITINSPGATVQLTDDFLLNPTRTFTLTAGTFDANNQNMSIGAFSSSNSNVRTLTVGSGTWNITGSSMTVLGLSGVNLILTTRPTFNFTGNGVVGNRFVTLGTFSEALAPNINIIAGSDTVIFSGSANTVDFSGFSGSLAISNRTIYGNLTLSPTMTITLGGNTTTFAATSGIQTITTSGVSFRQSIAINSLGATVQLADDLTLDPTQTFTLTAGTFDANNQNVSIGSFSSSNSNVRTLTVGSGIWNITGNNGTIWNTGIITNLTLTTRPTLNFIYIGGTGTRTITLGSTAESVAPNINITAGTDILSLTGSSNNLDFTGFSGSLTSATRTLYGNLILSSAMSITSGSSATTFASTSSTQTITTNGVLFNQNITVNAPGATVQLADDLTLDPARNLTLTAGTFDANNMNVSIGLFSSSNSNIRTLMVGSGTWNITGSGTVVWNTGTVTDFTLTTRPTLNFTYAGADGQRSFSSGFISEDKAPDINVTTGTDSFNPAGYFRNIDFTGFSGVLANNSRYIYGNLTYSPTMTTQETGNYTFLIGTSGTHIIDTKGIPLGTSLKLEAPGATYILANDLILYDNNPFVLASGNFDANSFDVTVNKVSDTWIGITDQPYHIEMSSGIWTMNEWDLQSLNHTTNPDTSTVVLTGEDSFIYGSNTFNNLTKEVTATSTLTFASSTTQTILGTLTLKGTEGTPLLLRSSTSGETWNIDPQETRDIEYVDVQDSTNLNALHMGADTILGFVDTGNNINWYFTPIAVDPDQESRYIRRSSLLPYVYMPLIFAQAQQMTEAFTLPTTPTQTPLYTPIQPTELTSSPQDQSTSDSTQGSAQPTQDPTDSQAECDAGECGEEASPVFTETYQDNTLSPASDAGLSRSVWDIIQYSFWWILLVLILLWVLRRVFGKRVG